jgi:lipopolysaccharide export system protein LptA
MTGPSFSVTCKRLDAHTKENFTIFSGNVVIDGERVRAYGEKANYYEKEEKLVIIGDPRSETKDDPPNVVRGRNITYFFKTDRAKATGDVKADIQPKKGNLLSQPTHITGEALTILPDRRYQVEGNLVAKRSDMTLMADRGIYDDTREITEAFGNVNVKTPKYVLESGYLKNYGLEERTIANIHPKLTQTVERKGKRRKSRIMGGDKEGDTGPARDRVILTATEVEALNGGSQIVARNDCKLVQTPWLGDEATEEVTATSTLTSDLMDVFVDEGKLVAKGNVELKGNDIVATGDRAIYWEEKGDRPEELIIEGNAKATQTKPNQKNPNTSTGERIHYFPQRDKIIIEKANITTFREQKDSLPEITDEVKLPKKVYKKKTGEAELGGGTGEVSLGAAGTGEAELAPAAAPGRTAEAGVRRAPPVRLRFGR